MSFVFWDTETTGLHTSFDQILQFGAIHTDHELREQDRFEVRCRLLPHVVPSAQALLTNGITVERLTDPALPSHYEMVRAVRARLESWSPAVFIGQNSMRFDEVLLRQAFYQTLHDPYLTNTGGNCRLDSLSIFRAVSLFAPGVLAVPPGERGQPVFGLASLAPANGFPHDAAHDAIGDAEATLYLCRRVRERAEGYWSNFVRFGPKAAAQDFVEGSEIFAFVDAAFGWPYCRILTLLGPNPDYRSELFVFNLEYDPQALAALADDDLGDALASTPVPVRGLRVNAGPCIVPYEDLPAETRRQFPDIKELRDRAAYLRTNKALAQRLMTATAAAREPWEPSPYVEEQIYDGFPGPADRSLMAAFSHSDRAWSERAALLARLADARLRVLAERLLYLEAPETLEEHERSRHEADTAKRLLADDDSVPWLTLHQAIRETDDLLANAAGAEASLIGGLRDSLSKRLEEARSFVT
ncbi:MAG: exonuclease domain-containing protein [Candidatus Tectomicrobia bacterium]|nr:exonuclease domain-containing protein [Candidatus Tectomicrobia bacterium]